MSATEVDAGRPARPAVVGRPGLVDALDRATAGPVTVISAPPGSGKTFLLRAWAARPEMARRTATMTVPRGERDAQRFWLGVLRAIRQVAHDDDRADDAIAPTAEFDGALAVDRVLAELEQAGAPLFLVIDDVHELESGDALAQLDDLLERLPATTHVVLASRRDPRLRLHRLRLEGQLAEIRAADLRFSDREAADLLKGSGLELTDDEVAVLQQRTEGWAAGLRLAAIAMAGHPAPAEFVDAFSGSDRTVSEYLLAELLERQPASVRRLLLRTSLVDRINGPLADLLTGSTGSQAVFQALEDANAFVVSVDPKRTWFRYHHLFGDLLRLELGRTAPDDVAELHRRAAGWLADHEEPAEAIRHAQAAGEWAMAARLLVDHALGLSLDGEQAAVHELLGAFPPSALDANPELAVVLASDELAQGSLQEAAAYLALADERADDVAPERRSRFSVMLAATKLSLARRRGNFADVMEQVDFLARPAGPRSPADIALGSELRAVALMNLGIVELWSLRLDEAREHLEEAAAIARRSGRRYLEVGCRAHLGFAAVDVSFAVGHARCAEAIALAERFGWGADPVIVPALAALGGTHAFSGEHDAAESALAAADAAIRREVEPATALLLHLSKGMLHAGRGEAADAVAQFRAGERMQTLLVTQHALAAQMRSFRIAMQVRLGLLADARASIAALERDLPLWGESLTAVACFRLAEDEPRAAVDVLARVFDGTAPVIHDFTIVQARMLAARALAELGDRPASEAAVEQALELAERERLVLPFAMAGGAELLQRHPRHSTAHAQLLTDIIDILGGGTAPMVGVPTPLDEPLSAGELRVLGHLPSNLSSPEIADQLFLSVNTVKTHMRHIYAKLGAHNRSEAVQRARELGLLARSAR